jgi:hypothetical protein
LTFVYIFRKDIYQQIKELKYTDVELLHTIEDLLIIGKIPLNTNQGQLAINIMMELVRIYRYAVERQYIEKDDRITDLSLFKSNHFTNLNSENVFGKNYVSGLELDEYINKIELAEALR